jgi:hypothetical protein
MHLEAGLALGDPFLKKQLGDVSRQYKGSGLYLYTLLRRLDRRRRSAAVISAYLLADHRRALTSFIGAMGLGLAPS